MRSNSSTKWTASYSMTYKGRFFLFTLLLCTLLSVHAAAAQQHLPGEADILLLHDEQLSDAQLDNLRLLADAATALGKSMELGTPVQASGRYNRYALIICYDLQPDAALARTLTRSNAKLLLLGGELLPDCLQAVAPDLTVHTVQRQENNGVLRFDFAGQQSYQAIVPLAQPLYTTDTEYKSGTLEADGQEYPFCMQSRGIRYIPLVDFTADLARAALMWELDVWLWDYSGLPPQKGQYWVLDEVYPYMPAQQLLDRVQVLVDANIPFVISVMPLYQNSDFPAMQQFCEVLRYAQANGGAVILHTPILRGTVTDWNAFNTAVTTAVTNLTAQGVYPLGFDVPYSWTWASDALAWMKRSRTIFVHPDTAASDFTRDTTQNLLYYNYNALVLPALSLDDGGENSILQFSAAQRVAASIPLEQLQVLVQQLQSDHCPYYNLWDSEQSVWADNFHLSWKNGALTVNDVLCSLAYTPQPAPEHYNYQRNILKRFTVSIQNESHFLIFLVAVVTLLFLLMILYARRRQRLHFLYRMPETAAPPAGSSAGAHAAPSRFLRWDKGGKHRCH